MIAASAGNHALALALHGLQLGVPVTVVMPKIAPLAKVQRCRQLKANVVLHGDTIADAREECNTREEWAELTYAQTLNPSRACVAKTISNRCTQFFFLVLQLHDSSKGWHIL